MIDGFWHKIRSYIDLGKEESISDYLEKVQIGTLVENKTPFDDYMQFFKELELDSINRAYTRTKTVNIQARSIEILLPQSIEEDAVKEFSTMFMKELLSKENLPYASWIVQEGKARYLRVLISERSYCDEPQEFKELWGSDGYRNKLNGQLCDCSDPNAVKCRDKGDVRRTYISHFSLKSRLFSADVDARKHGDDSERIGFKRFIDRVRQKLAYCFVFMKVKINKTLFLPKKKHFRSMNKYQVLNVKKCNEIIGYIERELQDLWQDLISDARYCHTKKNMDRFIGIFFKYRRIFEVGQFTYKTESSKKLKMKFNVYNNLVRFYETMDSLKAQFENDIEQVRINIYGQLIEE